MKIALVAAMAKNRVIGLGNQMPWHLPADLQHFKAITLNKPVIMGRKTFESIGRPLPKRRNIVITRQQDWQVEGCEVVNSLEAALQLVKDEAGVMIIGGGNIYQQALPQATHLYLTYIDLDVDGDTYFPEWDENEWRVVETKQHEPDENNSYSYCFVALEKV